MSIIFKLRYATAIIEAVMQQGRAGERISENDVLLFVWRGDQPGLPASELAWRCGRSRQNVQRALERLERRKFVERLDSVVTGKTCGWVFTPRGPQVWKSVLGRITAYDAMLARAAPQAREVAEALVKVMEQLVDPARAGTPAQRLVRPPRRTRTPQWDL